MRKFKFPGNDDEARAVFRKWDRRNGRYYIIGRVRLSDGSVLESVTFDGDSLIAVELAGRPISNHPELYLRDISGVEVISSTMSSFPQGEEIRQ